MSTKERLDSVQILRFIAATSVVLLHLSAPLNQKFDSPLLDFPNGRAGVDIFFVISGFIIAYTAAGTRDAVEFMKRRIFRVVPIYWLLTLGVFSIALIAPALLKNTDANPILLLKSLFFVPYEKPNGLIQPVLFLGWTLNYEMFFYATFAIALSLTTRFRTALTVFFALLVAAGQLLSSNHVFVRFYTDPIILEFVLGLWIHALWTQRRDLLPKLWPLAPIGAALIILQPTDPLLAHRFFVYGLPAALLMLGMVGLAIPKNPVTNLMLLLGNASYSMYLSHVYVITLAYKVILPRVGQSAELALGMAFATLAVVCVVSVILYKLVEFPSNTFLRRLFPTRATATTPQMATP